MTAVPRLRRKRWNYWCIASDDLVFAITLADVGYLGVAIGSLLDVRTGALVEKVVATPLAAFVSIRDEPLGGTTFDRFGLSVAIVPCGDETRLHARFRDVEALFAIDHRPAPLDVVVPFDGARAQRTSKHVGLPVEGTIAIGSRVHRVASPHAHATLDFGWGRWPYRTRWQWAAAAKTDGGRTIATNLGGTWTRGTGATENALFVEGVVHPIGDDLVFDLDPDGFPRRITTRAGARAFVDLAFEPVRTRAVSLDGRVLASRLRWGFGRFRGVVVAADGTSADLTGARGFAEDHLARW